MGRGLGDGNDILDTDAVAELQSLLASRRRWAQTFPAIECSTCGSGVQLRGWLLEALDGLDEHAAAVEAQLGETHRRGTGWQSSQQDWRALAEKLGAERDQLEARLAAAEELLDRFATGKRPDGTYNLSREAVEQLAARYREQAE